LYYDFFDSSNNYLNGTSALCISGVTVVAGEDGKGDTGTFSLEDYVAGVITRENFYPDGGDNIESMKAQAIAARTYVLSRTSYCTKPIVNSQGLQTFSADVEPLAAKAAKETEGLILTYNGEIFASEYDAYYCTEVMDCIAGGMCTCEYTKEPIPEKHIVSIPTDFIRYGGNGHGRGMSQEASNYLQSAMGYNYKQILEYWYSPGVQITQSIASGNDGSVAYANGVFTVPANGVSGYPDSKGSGKYKLNIYFWQMLNKFLTAANDAGYNIGVTDGWRSYEAQVTCKKDKPTLCTTPGKSKHGWGIAADLNYYESKAATDWAHTHATEYGLEFNVCANYFGGSCSEPWHIQPINIEYK
jgi:hypothetical protein